MEYNVEELIFSSDHFGVNNTNKKISTVIS